MNYLLIENKGELDINALILMGGSTKRGDETFIGHFGSGNKYALALLLREKIPFRIFSGKNEVLLTTETVSFREKQFEKILVNGQETSLTTDMGPQWEMWQAIREFVSNAIDEKEYNFIDSTSNVEPRVGYTRIYIPHIPEVEVVINNWDSYFAFDRTDELVNIAGEKVYPQTNKDEDLILYRKNIRCLKVAWKSLYQYDLKNFKINESRVVEDTMDAKALIIKFLCNHANEAIAYRILLEGHNHKYYEETFSWWHYCDKLNPDWRVVIGNRIIVVRDFAGWYAEELAQNPYFLVTQELARLICQSFPDVKVYGLSGGWNKGVFKSKTPSEKMKAMLKKAEHFFEETNYKINYPIAIGQFDKVNQLGGVGVNEIQISTQVFDMGMKELVMTIMEENEHLLTKHQDCSRDFQNHWIKLFLTEKEERFAYFL